MVLIPIERLKAYEKKATDTPAVPPDIELKLLKQREARRRPRKQPPQKPLTLDFTSYPREHERRAKETVMHINNNKDRLGYDQNTGEFSYDGIKAADSDVRELVSTLASSSKRKSNPKGWELFVQSLEDSEAPSNIYGGWRYEKAAKGDWAALR